MISHLCRQKARGSVLNRCLTSSTERWAAARVTLVISFLFSLKILTSFILSQNANWYHILICNCPEMWIWPTLGDLSSSADGFDNLHPPEKRFSETSS